MRPPREWKVFKHNSWKMEEGLNAAERGGWTVYTLFQPDGYPHDVMIVCWRYAPEAPEKSPLAPDQITWDVV